MSLRFIAILFLSLIIGFNPQPALASSDTTVICKQQGECTFQGKERTLFSETNVAPGEFRKKNIKIVNQNSKWACAIKLGIKDAVSNFEEENALSSQIVFNVDTKLFSLKDLSNPEQQPILGYVSPQSNKEFILQAGISAKTTNDMQGKSANFDIALIFICDEPSKTSPPVTIKPRYQNSVLGASTAEASCSENTYAPKLELVTANVIKKEVVVRWVTVGTPTQVLLTINNNDDKLSYQSDVTNKQKHIIKGLEEKNYELFLEASSSCDKAVSNIITANLGTEWDALEEQATNSSQPSVLGTSIDEGELIVTKAFSLFYKVLLYVIIGLTVIVLIKYSFKKL